MNQQKFTIEKNIPIPQTGKRIFDKFPLDKLNVKESFKASDEFTPQIQNNVHNRIKAAVKRHKLNRQFVVREYKGGTWVWRVK